MSLSIAICIFNDFDHIMECINRVYDYADEIVILDGPYLYCEPILDYFDFNYATPPSPLLPITALPKVRYEYRIFENESEKRVHLYNMCRCDVVMLLDSDELLDEFDENAYTQFVDGSYAVASACLVNMVRHNKAISAPALKHIFFKRSTIPASDHLDYTWLVGVDQKQADQTKIFPGSIAVFAHLTLMRSYRYSLIKYCFYTRLYYYSRSQMDDTRRLFGLTFHQLRQLGWDVDDVKYVFGHSIPDLINFTRVAPLQDVKLHTVDSEYDRILATRPLTKQERVVLMSNIDSFHYISLPDHLIAGDPIEFSFQSTHDGVLQVNLIVHTGVEIVNVDPEDMYKSRERELHLRFILPCDIGDIFHALIVFKPVGSGDAVLSTLTNFTMKRRIAIYGNCQTETLRDFLRTSPEFEREFAFEETPGRLVHMMTGEELGEFYGILRRIDILITQPVTKTFREPIDFSTTRLIRDLRPDASVFVFPNLFFTAYSPDSYCITYRNRFLREPMPIHDVNLIYLYLRQCGDRREIEASYSALLESTSFYPIEYVKQLAERDIRELTVRERSARVEFQDDSRVTVYSYSDFVEAWYRRVLLHYSDAHPTEFVFYALSKAVLLWLGLDDNCPGRPVSERGVLPFYRSVEVSLNVPLRGTGIYLNDRPIGFGEFVSAYVDAYAKESEEALFGYIEGRVTKIVVTNHKTGTRLMEQIVREYCAWKHLKFVDFNNVVARNPNLRDIEAEVFGVDFIFISHAQHFGRLLGAVPHLRYRVLHVVRHPYEVIMSGARYHRVTDEEWCNLPAFVRDASHEAGFRQIAPFDATTRDEGLLSYRDIMSELDQREGVRFEILSHVSTFGTIPSMVAFIRNYRCDGNVATIPLEAVRDDASVDFVFEFLGLDAEFRTSYKHLVGSKDWLGDHVTSQSTEYTFPSAFDDELVSLFEREFGESVLQELGYSSSGSTLAGSKPRIRTGMEARRSPPVEGSLGSDPSLGDGGNRVASEEVWNSMYAHADRLLELGELKSAKSEFSRCLSLRPNSVSARGRLGDVCVRLNEFQEARIHFTDIIASTVPTPGWAYVGLANALEGLGLRAEALAQLELASQIEGKSEALDTRISALRLASGT